MPAYPPGGTEIVSVFSEAYGRDGTQATHERSGFGWHTNNTRAEWVWMAHKQHMSGVGLDALKTKRREGTQHYEKRQHADFGQHDSDGTSRKVTRPCGIEHGAEPALCHRLASVHSTDV